MVSQIELMSAVCKWLDKHGEKNVNIRQMNSIVQATNMIVDALNEPHVPATAGMGLDAWLACDETGASSQVMSSRLTGRPFRHRRDTEYPHDPGDFGRCVGFLDAVPEAREKLTTMRDVSPQWAALIDNWQELESLYREEQPSGSAPKLYARMQELLTAKEVADAAQN